MSVIYKSLQQLQEKEQARPTATTPQAVAPRMQQVVLRGGLIIVVVLVLVASSIFAIKTHIESIQAPPPPDTTVGAAKAAPAPQAPPAEAVAKPKEAPKLAPQEPLMAQRLHRETPESGPAPLDLTKPTKALDVHFSDKARKNEQVLSLEKKLAQSVDKGDASASREILGSMSGEIGKQESTTKYKWDGYLALKEKRYPDAENFYRRALAIKPNDFVSQLNLTYALMGQGKTKDAEAIYRTLMERYPMNDKVLTVGKALGLR